MAQRWNLPLREVRKNADEGRRGMSPDEIRRMTMQALKRYRDHVERLSGRNYVGSLDASQNCEWIGWYGVAAKLAGCSQVIADESTVLSSRALSRNLIQVDGFMASFDSITCKEIWLTSQCIWLSYF